MTRRNGATTSLEHGNRQAWLLGTIAVLLVVCLATTIAVGAKEISDTKTASNRRAAIVAAQQAALECVARWANTYSQRSQQLTQANADRVKALDVLVRSIRGATAARFQRALSAYLAASNRVDQQAKTHPLPPAPQFLCADLDAAHARPVPLPSVVTVTRTPPPATVTRTTTVPAPTATRYVPRPATTVTVPGPVRTRIVTVTVPPGRSH